MAVGHLFRETTLRSRTMARLLITGSAIAGTAGVAQAQTTAQQVPTSQAGEASSATPGEQTSNTAPAGQDLATAPVGEASPGGQTGDIVVTGYRQSIEASLSQKRNANAFIDVITAEDVGKFPDKNVADSLQRVPGVIINRDGGEGSTVSIRGLSSDLTLTELNGNFLASSGADPSRSFDYLLLPSNLIASVEVFKSPEARLDEGGVGGVIINHTRKPFDLKPWSGNLQIEGTYADVTKKTEPDASGLLSWHNANKTLGFLVAATYQERTNRTLSAGADSWQWWTYGGRANGKPATDVNGNTFANDDAVTYWSQNTGETTQDGTVYDGYWAPQSVHETILDQKRKRLGIQATAQMRPFDNLTITANYFRFQLKGNYVSDTIKIPEWGYDNFFTQGTLDPSGTVLTSATFQVPPEGTACREVTADNPNPCTMETPAPQDTLQREKEVSNTFDVHGDWTHDRLDVSFVLGKTKASGGPGFSFFTQAKPRLTTGAGAANNVNGNTLSAWNFTNHSLAMQFSPDIIDNFQKGIGQIDLGSTGSGFDDSTTSQRYAQVDITRHFDSFVKSIQIGAKWRDTSIEKINGEYRWYSDAANTLRFQDTPGAAVALPEFFYPESIGNIAGGFETTAFPAIDMKKYIQYLNDTYNGPVYYPQPQNKYDIGERIWAGYAQLNYGTEAIRGNLGVRVVNTHESGISTDVLYYENAYCQHEDPNDYTSPPLEGGDGNCLVYPLEDRETRVFSPHRASKSYTDVLPSFNISWNATSNLLIRGEVSKVMSRPSYGDLAGSRSLTFNSDWFVHDRAQFGALPGWFGGGGNFDLEPFRAWQYDIGVEWYFHRGSVLGATLFRKDVSNFIVPVVIDLPQDVAGETVTVQQYSTETNGSSAVSQGVEVYAQHTLDFGLGAQVNFTYNDTSQADVSLNGQKIGTSPLVGSAKTQFNASVFYEHGPVLLRASYNRKGAVVEGLISGLNVYDNPYQQVDLNASYNIFDNLQLTASVINLTKEEESSHLGNDTKARFLSNSYSGRRFYFGLSYNF